MWDDLEEQVEVLEAQQMGLEELEELSVGRASGPVEPGELLAVLATGLEARVELGEGEVRPPEAEEAPLVVLEHLKTVEAEEERAALVVGLKTQRSTEEVEELGEVRMGRLREAEGEHEGEQAKNDRWLTEVEELFLEGEALCSVGPRQAAEAEVVVEERGPKR